MCAVPVIVLVVALASAGRTFAAVSWGKASEMPLPANAGSIESPIFQAQTAGADSVSCSALGSCVAAGQYRDSSVNGQAMVVASSGGTWSPGDEITPPANAMTNPYAELRAIACPGLGVCVAAGSYSTESEGSPRDEAMVVGESNGTWGQASEVTLPPDSATESSPLLSGVACATPGSCFAVGSYRDSSSSLEAMAVSDSGGTWSKALRISLPANAASDPHGWAMLTSVACPAAESCVAVGYYEDNVGDTRAMIVDQSNGTWDQAREIAAPANAVSNPRATLDSITCDALGSCVAVGQYLEGSGSQAMAVEETAGVWGQASEITPPPNAASYASLLSVSCPATGQCVAVGVYNASSGGSAMIVSQSDGTWGQASQILPPFGPTEAALLSIACPALGSCVAVGQYTANSEKADYEAMIVTAGPQGNITTPTTSTPSAAASATTSTNTTSSTQPMTGRASLVGHSLTVQNGDAAIKLSCKGLARCSGTLTLGIKVTTGEGENKHTHHILIGKTNFSIRPGTIVVKIRLTAAGRKRVHASYGRLHATLTILLSTPPNQPTTTEKVRLIQHAAAAMTRKR